MRKPQLLVWVAVLGAAALHCAAPRPPAPQLARTGKKTPPPPAPAEPAEPVEPAPPEELLGTLVFGNLDQALSQALGYVQPYVAPPFRALLEPAPIQAQLAKALGFPGLEQAVDSRRALVLACADPLRHPPRGKLGPLVLAVPVRDEGALLNRLRQQASDYRRGPWNSHVLVYGANEVWLRFAERYALLAADQPLVDAAPALLLPLTRTPLPQAVRLHIDVAATQRRYGTQIAAAVARARSTKDAQAGNALQRVEQWLAYLSSIAELNLTLALEASAIKLDGRVTALPSGAFPTYLAQLRPGPAWGAQFLPAGSAVAVLSRSTPQLASAELEGSLSMLQTLFKEQIPASSWEALREALVQSTSFLSGESAVALWANPDSTASWGGAVKLLGDSAAGHAALLKGLQLVGQQLEKLMTRLPPTLAPQLKGVRLALKVRPAAVRIGTTRAALVELELRGSEPSAQELIRKLKTVLGPRLTTAMVVFGDTLLLSGGKDYRRQLAQMLASAKAAPGAGLEPIVQRTLGGRQMVSYVYLPVATFAEQALRLAERVATVPPPLKEVLQKVLPGASNSIPITALVSAEPPRLVLEMTISPALVGVITQVVMEIISRMGMGGVSPP